MGAGQTREVPEVARTWETAWRCEDLRPGGYTCRTVCGRVARWEFVPVADGLNDGLEILNVVDTTWPGFVQLFYKHYTSAPPCHSTSTSPDRHLHRVFKAIIAEREGIVVSLLAIKHERNRSG